MDKYTNYYALLGLSNTATQKQIKMAYYKISMVSHPDKGGDVEEFKKISEAYKILSDDVLKKEFDIKSKYGNSYNEFNELLEYEFNNNAKNYDKKKYEDFVKRDQLNILIYIDDSFNGSVEYERWVPCKDCNGSGINVRSKMSYNSSVPEIKYFRTEEEAEDFIQDPDIIGEPIAEIVSSISLLKFINELKENDNIKYEEYLEKKELYESQDDFIKVSIKRRPAFNPIDLSESCDFCFEENNYVITDNGPIKINNIKIGDLVLSQDNVYQKVYNTLNRIYTGDVFDMDICGIKINGVTPNHKFNVVRFERTTQGRIKINNYKVLEIPAEELNNDDFILYQCQKYKTNNKIIMDKTLNRDYKEIIVDSDFIKFIACYIAEGCTRGDRVVVLTFDKFKDKTLIDFIMYYAENILKDSVKILKNQKGWGDRVCKIEIYNSQLAKFIKNFCGHLAENKFIHSNILGSFSEILLNTLISCDGSIKRNTKTYTTVSRKLAYQIFHLSNDLGYNTTISSHEASVDNNGVNHKIYYRVYITKSIKMGLYKKVIDGQICLKIRDIQKRNVINSYVYNISVNKTHKYTIDGLLVNNCDGTGKWGEYDCFYCVGNGKVNGSKCSKCKGEKRILGKQKLNNISFPKNEKDFKIEHMGNYSKDIPGKSGHVWLIKKEDK